MSLKLAWDGGWRQVVFEMDSWAAVHMVKTGCPKTHQCSSLIKAIQSLLRRQWKTMLVHCYRESNAVADRLANFAHAEEVLSEGLVTWLTPPSWCLAEVESDIRGVSVPRLCAR